MKFYFILFLFVPKILLSFCYEPSPPWSKPSKPMVPWCVDEWTNTHTCSDWEIDSYNDSIRNYNYEVENYISDLQYYVNAAHDYASCEIRNLD